MRKIIISVVTLALSACAEATPPPRPVTAPPVLLQSTVSPPGSGTQYIRVPLTESGGTPHVAVGIAGVCCFKFTVDSGASDVTVSPAIFKAMVDGGHVTDDDLIDVRKYRTASGAVIEGLRFRMPPMSIGGHTVRNVVGSVSPRSGNTMLLGQSFLRKFRVWAIDNKAGVLVLG